MTYQLIYQLYTVDKLNLQLLLSILLIVNTSQWTILAFIFIYCTKKLKHLAVVTAFVLLTFS